jgi:outer membrane lipoprotein-sorting protein
MEMRRTRGPAAGGYAWLWKLVLAAGTVGLGGCCLPYANSVVPPKSPLPCQSITPWCSRPRADGVVPPAPIAAVAGAEPAPPAALQDDVETILKQMEAAYDEVKDYQTEVEVILFQEDGSIKSEKSLYTFKKPKWIRLDSLSPHPGIIMVYPDRNGKVLVKLQGLLSLLTFHLRLDDPLLRTPSGQRMNQTDLGLLIRNIRHSVADHRRGPVLVSEDKNTIQLQVLADDHFREGVETQYQFLVSKELRLPLEVGMSTANGVQEGKIIFRNLRTNINIPDDLFQ